jgi:hypothetical protein
MMFAGNVGSTPGSFMARKRLPHERKLRTREHVLADLSVNFVERQILLRGFAAFSPSTDYGIDLVMTTFDESGEVETGHVLFQIKATDTVHVIDCGASISIRVAMADLKAWQVEVMPVILILYDGKNDLAYWIWMQQYLDEKKVTGDDVLAGQDRVTVRIPAENRLELSAIDRFRQMRERELEIWRRRRHGT